MGLTSLFTCGAGTKSTAKKKWKTAPALKNVDRKRDDLLLTKPHGPLAS